MARLAAARSGIDPATGDWTPAFPGQRRPFPPGHTISMLSGVNSERVVGPLAGQIMAEMLHDPKPPYLAQPILRGLVAQYARVQAQQRLLLLLLEEIGWPWEPDDDEEQEPPFRMPLWRRREAAYKAFWRSQTRTSALIGKLGLSPMSQVTAPKDALWRQAEAAWLKEQRRRPG